MVPSMSENTVFRLLDTTIAFHADEPLASVLRDAYVDLATTPTPAAHVVEVHRRLGGRWRTTLDGVVREQIGRAHV